MVKSGGPGEDGAGAGGRDGGADDAERLSKYLAAVDELHARPYAPGRTWRSEGGWSAAGPGFHIEPLQVSETFEEDTDGTAYAAAETRFEDDLRALTDALAARWGAGTAVDMLDAYYRYEEGEALPPVYAQLCEMSLAGELWRWRTAHRAVAVGLAQENDVRPFVLFVTVWDE